MGKLIVRIASLLLIAAFLPTAVLAAEWNLENGSIEITATANAEGGTTQTVSQGGSSAEDSNPTITSNGKETGNTITINPTQAAVQPPMASVPIQARPGVGAKRAAT